MAGAGPGAAAGNRAAVFAGRARAVSALERRRPAAGYEEIAGTLERLAAEVDKHYADLEALEQRLTVLEEKTIAIARTRQSEERCSKPARVGPRLRPTAASDGGPVALLESATWSATCWKRRAARLSLFYMR